MTSDFVTHGENTGFCQVAVTEQTTEPNSYEAYGAMSGGKWCLNSLRHKLVFISVNMLGNVAHMSFMYVVAMYRYLGASLGVLSLLIRGRKSVKKQEELWGRNLCIGVFVCVCHVGVHDDDDDDAFMQLFAVGLWLHVGMKQSVPEMKRCDITAVPHIQMQIKPQR